MEGCSGASPPALFFFSFSFASPSMCLYRFVFIAVVFLRAATAPLPPLAAFPSLPYSVSLPTCPCYGRERVKHARLCFRLPIFLLLFFCRTSFPCFSLLDFLTLSVVSGHPPTPHATQMKKKSACFALPPPLFFFFLFPGYSCLPFSYLSVLCCCCCFLS